MRKFNLLLGMLSPAEKKRGFKVLCLVGGLALLDTAGIASVMPFLAVIGDPQTVYSNKLLNRIYLESIRIGVDDIGEFVFFLGMGALITMVLSAAYRAITLNLTNKFVESCGHGIASRLLEIYIRQPYSFFIKSNSGELSKKILSEVDLLLFHVIRPAINMLASIGVVISICALLIVVNPLIAFITTLMFSIQYLVVFQMLKNKLKSIGFDVVQENKKRFVSVGEIVGGIKQIIVSGSEDYYLNKFIVASNIFSLRQATLMTLSQVPHVFIETFIFGSMMILVLILHYYTNGSSNNQMGNVLPILGLYGIAAYKMKPAVQNIFTGFSGLRSGAAIIENISFDFKLKHNVRKPVVKKLQSLKFASKIEVCNVSYNHENSDRATLKDVVFDIKRGECVGFVGSSGSGKSTMVDLILGLISPTVGCIKIDNVDLSGAVINSWNRLIGYVPQEVYINDSSISENIAFGIPKTEIDHDKILKCSKIAQLDGFIINQLPDKYDTKIGENGIRLSGGQRQRIGIARALYLEPEVIIFDEGTSALDNITEHTVMAAIKSIKSVKTIILIAHRLSTVIDCDQIILFENGAIKAKGNYNFLLKNCTEFKGFVFANET